MKDVDNCIFTFSSECLVECVSPSVLTYAGVRDALRNSSENESYLYVRGVNNVYRTSFSHIILQFSISNYVANKGD